MKTKLIFTLFSALLILLIYSCAEENNKGQFEGEETIAPTENRSDSIGEKIDTDEILIEPDEVKDVEGIVEKQSKSWKDQSQIIDERKGEEMDNDTMGDLLNDSAEEIGITKGGECGGPGCGKVVLLENYNNEKDITALVEINWKENGAKKKVKRTYLVKSSEKLEIGCSAKCTGDEKISVKWKIIGASYAI